MCGLAGIYRLESITENDVDVIDRMNVCLKHRGPDDEGLYHDSNCVLGHRRLAIIDLSKAGRQPFVSDDRRYYLVYNGEIYNYIELREELRQIGWRFHTNTDTEVLLKAYQQYGPGCLPRFNGMFAFAIYDAEKRSLFLARDRIGIKPLYYVLDNSTLYFASEIKALLKIPGFQVTANYQSLFDYFVFNRTDVFDETFFKQVHRLPKGSYATFERDTLQTTQWWNPEDYVRDSWEDPSEDVLRKIEALLISAAQLRMRSDVRVGSCLSGGLDSSILIGILFSHYALEEAYPSFTAAFPGHPIDETRYVDDLNRRYDFQNYKTFPTADKAYNDLNDFVYANDEPTTNPSFYSQYEVMRLAKSHDVTVLLDGQGGDENFAGYQYFHGFYWTGLLKHKKMLQLASEICKSIVRRQDRSAYQTFLFQVLSHARRKRLLLRTVAYLQPEFFYEYIDSSIIYNDFFDSNGLNTSLVRHFQHKLEHLLRMEDRNSMAFSLEARVPYLDHRLVEYILGVPEDLKIKNGETKYLQKKALHQYTVPEILNRRDKIGFGTPGEEWMAAKNWQARTSESYRRLSEKFPEVFIRNMKLPTGGFDRWKINQLATWCHTFSVR
jgi:asparagine synthase (glutamine-hydrolysing)